jgi:hypothetical protein
MNKLILTLTAFASVVMPVIGGEPIGPVLASPTTSDQEALILRILKAVETHDYRTLLIYTSDKETDYFGHKNSSNAFIQQDMTQDARSYKWCKFAPDLSTFQTSLGHDSIEYDSDALDVRGEAHKARCRLDIYYTPTTSPRLQAVSLKVLPNHLQSGTSVSTVTGSSSGQNIESWTPQSLTARFGADAVNAKYVGGRIRNITFSAGPHGNFHGDQCFGLILEVLRGDKENPIGEDSNLEFDNDNGIWVDHETGCTIRAGTLDGKPTKSFAFFVTQGGSVVLTAHVVEWRSGGPHGGPELYLDIN